MDGGLCRSQTAHSSSVRILIIVQSINFVPCVVVQVSAGAAHSIVLTEAGAVFTFGKGATGRLGHGDELDRVVPAAVGALSGQRATQVSQSVCPSSRPRRA